MISAKNGERPRLSESAVRKWFLIRVTLLGGFVAGLTAWGWLAPGMGAALPFGGIGLYIAGLFMLSGIPKSWADRVLLAVLVAMGSLVFIMILISCTMLDSWDAIALGGMAVGVLCLEIILAISWSVGKRILRRRRERIEARERMVQKVRLARGATPGDDAKRYQERDVEQVIREKGT